MSRAAESALQIGQEGVGAVYRQAPVGVTTCGEGTYGCGVTFIERESGDPGESSVSEVGSLSHRRLDRDLVPLTVLRVENLGIPHVAPFSMHICSASKPGKRTKTAEVGSDL